MCNQGLQNGEKLHIVTVLREQVCTSGLDPWPFNISICIKLDQSVFCRKLKYLQRACKEWEWLNTQLQKQPGISKFNNSTCENDGAAEIHDNTSSESGKS